MRDFRLCRRLDSSEPPAPTGFTVYRVRLIKKYFATKNPFPILSDTLHEKGLQRQKGVGPLVSSQEERALFVPRLNRLSTVGQPRVSFLHLFT